MQKTGIVLAGGFSSRFGQDKGLLHLADKPLIKHVLDSMEKVVDDKIVVLSSKAQVEKYAGTIGPNCKILVDSTELHGPLAGAFTGFREASGDYSLLLPCDTPFVSTDVISFLMELCVNKNAAIPRWPNCYLEPLHAVYRTKSAVDAAEKTLLTGQVNMQAMVNNLRNVRYVSTLVLEQLDKELRTFFNINAPLDLRKAEIMLKHQEKRAAFEGEDHQA